MSKVAIRVEHLAKRYQLGTIGYGSLQHDLSAWWARIRGIEDPNSKIGERSKLDLHGDFWALRDISFEVGEGDRVGIVGKNGAGKSTLLKLLSRVTSPTEGRIHVRGRIASLLEVGTGFHPELTGRENVFLNGAILGMKRREIQAKFDQIVDFAGVSQFIDTPVKRYSSGMYVRLAFSVAAHLDSEILIVDEVLAVGDAEFQEKCVAKMNSISQADGRTVFFVSHNLATLSKLCKSGLLLSKGKLIESGGMDKCLQQYLGQGSNGVQPLGPQWSNTNAGSFDESVRVHRIWLEDSAGPLTTNQLLNSRSYRVLAELELFKDEPHLTVFFSVYTLTGDLVFIADIQHDAAVARAVRTKGSHRISVGVPQDLLLSKHYFFELSCLIHGSGWPLPPGPDQRIEVAFRDDTLKFDLDYNDLSHPFTGDAQPGVVAPRLRWYLG